MMLSPEEQRRFSSEEEKDYVVEYSEMDCSRDDLVDLVLEDANSPDQMQIGVAASPGCFVTPPPPAPEVAHEPLCAASAAIYRNFCELRGMARLAHSKAVAAGEEWPRATEIIPGFLWLGDEDDAADTEWLEAQGITHILNCAGPSARGNTRNRVYFELRAEDSPQYDLLGGHMATAQAFIDNARAGITGRPGLPSKVLVHCIAGVNRSAVICVAYMMARGHCMDWRDDMGLCRGSPLLDVTRHILSRRPIVLKNDHFVRQLIKCELARRANSIAVGESGRPRGLSYPAEGVSGRCGRA